MGNVQAAFKLRSQKFGRQAQVDEAGSRHFGCCKRAFTVQFVGNFLRQLTRILLGCLRRTHGTVDLEIAEIGVFGRLQHNRAARHTCSSKGGFDLGG